MNIVKFSSPARKIDWPQATERLYFSSG